MFVVLGLFDFVGGAVIKRRVKSFLIVAQLNVACDVFHGVSACRIDGSVHPHDLQGGIEGFDPGVVITDPGPAHRTGDARRDGEVGELLRGVLGELNRSMQHRVVGVSVAARRCIVP